MAMDSIQQEAMRRVQAMQSGAASRQHTPPAHKHTEPQRQVAEPVSHQPPLREEEPPMPPKQPPEVKATQSGEGALEVLFKDKEQNLILMLILLLSGDGADASLLLALMYLLI